MTLCTLSKARDHSHKLQLGATYYTVYLEQSGSFLLLRAAYVDTVDNEYLITGNQLTINIRHAAFYLTSHTTHVT